jgi:uncharacterized protein (TIGR02391 family)
MSFEPPSGKSRPTRKRTYPPWPEQVVQQVASVLADTENGISGRQVGDFLQTCGLARHDPGMQVGSKRRRLFVALWNYQVQTNTSNGTIKFITHVMHPPIGDPTRWSQRREGLNEALTYVGCHVMEDGRLGSGERARTRDDAVRLADSVRAEAQRGNCHPQALAACAPEAIQRNWFHASLEAVKGLLGYLREAANLNLDGTALIDAVMGGDAPPIRINELHTRSDRNEQTGLADITRGIVKMYRHPTAHDSARERGVTRTDFLDLLSVLSMVYRRLDNRIQWDSRQ